MDKQLSSEGSLTGRTQGECLRLAREEQGWSQAQLASQIGVSPKTVKRWEGNQASPHPYAARKLCTVLQKSREELMLGRLIAEPTRISEEPSRLRKGRPFKLSRRLLLTSAVLSVLIVGGLGVVLWVSHSASSASSQAPSWHPLLRQPAPDCQNKPGVGWYVYNQATHISCQPSGLVVQQVGNFYAEVDLRSVNGRSYDQKTFRVQVQVSFLNPKDGATFATILVQTPTAVNALGGYILAINPSGYWQLQDVRSSGELPAVKDGSVSINLARPTTMTVEVYQGMLYAAINGSWVVVSYPDQLQPSPGVVSLEVQKTGNLSSPVRYSNFELDQ